MRAWIFATFVAGNLFPDVDLIYFYTIDHQRHHHHYFWTHLPVFWFVLLLAVYCIAFCVGRRTWAILSLSFIAGVFLHLLMDTFAGDIAWFYPYSPRLFHLVAVPDRYGWWVWNFFFHWTFLVEIVIWLAAIIFYFRRHRARTDGNS